LQEGRTIEIDLISIDQAAAQLHRTDAIDFDVVPADRN
jgi:hypothetical protein